MDAETVFEAASISKPLFAYIVLKLAEAGTLDLDAPLGATEAVAAQLGHDARAAVLTPRMILAHMGGSTLWVASTVLWQKHVADGFRGRVYTLEFLGMTLAFSAGGLLAGWIYDATASLDLTIWAMSTVVLVAGAGWVALARRGAALPDPAA